jgi:hypothetical protein
MRVRPIPAPIPQFVEKINERRDYQYATKARIRQPSNF